MTHRLKGKASCAEHGDFAVDQDYGPVRCPICQIVVYTPERPAGLTYAKVGGPPDDWAKLQVRDLDSGEIVDRVVEVNSAEGWVIISHRRVDQSHIGPEKIKGRFAIERQP